MVTFSVGGNAPGGRLMDLMFVALGFLLLLGAAGFSLYTISWLAAYEQRDGTIVAVRHGHAIVEGVTASGDIIRVIDSARTDPPPVVGSSRVLAMPPGHPGDALVVGFMNTWFAPALLGAMGVIFGFVGLMTFVFGASRRSGPSFHAGAYGEPETTIINNYYRDDSTTYTS